MEIASGFDKGLGKFVAIATEKQFIAEKLQKNRLSEGKKEKLMYRFKSLSDIVPNIVKENFI